MTSVSISQLKTNPSKVLLSAEDYPIAIENRSQVKGYLLGKKLYEKLVLFIEDYIDKEATETTDFRKGKDFEAVAKELGI
ncbi:MAG: antitoxin [Patescibacteria group bacterium]